MKKLRTFWLLLSLGLATLAGACDNTIRGAGRDIHDTGEAIDDAVE